MIKKIYFISIKFLLQIHTYSYKIVSFLVKKLEKNYLHPKHRIMNYHQFFINNIKKGDKVLDLGCGNGALTYDLGEKASSVVGIDLNEKNIQTARREYGRENIKYIIGDITRDFSNQRFDVIILSNVLEHIKNRLAFLESIRPLAPKIIIRVPMINRDWITLYKKELGVEWRLDNTHQTEYTFKTFKKEIEQAGFIIENYSVQFGEIWAVIRCATPSVDVQHSVLHTSSEKYGQ